MILSPSFVLCALYVFANFYALILGSADGGMQLEGGFYQLKSSSLIIAYVLQVLIIFLLWLGFRAFEKKELVKFYLGSRVGLGLLGIQISYIIFNKYYGVNIAGTDSLIEGGSFLNYLFIFLQPDLMFLVVGVFLVSTRLFLVNVFVFLISMMLRGWMGGIFLVVIVILCRCYPLKLRRQTIALYILSAVLLLLSLPFIIQAKWVARTDEPLYTVFQSVFDFGYLNYLGVSLDYILNRFQHVGHIALLFENSVALKSAYESEKFIPYWFDGLPQYIMMKILGINPYKLNSYIVEHFFGVNNPTWNINPGLAGWIVILKEKTIFFSLYIASIVAIPFYVVSRYGGVRILLLVYCFSVVYLFHGWIGAYFNMALYAMLIVVLSKFKFRLTSSGR